MNRSALNAALAKEQEFLCNIIKRGGSLSADDVCEALDRIWAAATAAPPTLMPPADKA